MANKASEALKAGLRSLFVTGKHSDLILHCDSDSKIFNVHKAILCAQSKYFQKACDPENFMENFISVDTAIDSATMTLLLYYLYTTEYEDSAVGAPEAESLLINVNVYVAADFYDIAALRELAALKFKDALTTHWDSELFHQAIGIIYTKTPSTDPTLRDIVLEVIVEHALELLHLSSGTKSTGLVEVMDEIPEVGKDIAMGMLAEFNKTKAMLSEAKAIKAKWMGYRKLQCQICNHMWADARAEIPDGTTCPGCERALYRWDSYQVE